MEIYEINLDNKINDAFGLVNLSDKTYVCPGWHEVPFGTTREQIKIVKNKQSPKIEVEPEVKPVQITEWKVKGSKDNVYEVSVKGGFWDCTCPAKSFRRGDCKHIKGIKETL